MTITDLHVTVAFQAILSSSIRGYVPQDKFVTFANI
jgi:hypothetical protein